VGVQKLFAVFRLLFGVWRLFLVLVLFPSNSSICSMSSKCYEIKSIEPLKPIEPFEQLDHLTLIILSLLTLSQYFFATNNIPKLSPSSLPKCL